MLGLFEKDDVICAYSTQDAIDDGVLIDVTDTKAAKDAKFKVSKVILSNSLYAKHIEPNADRKSVV